MKLATSVLLLCLSFFKASPAYAIKGLEDTWGADCAYMLLSSFERQLPQKAIGLKVISDPALGEQVLKKLEELNNDLYHRPERYERIDYLGKIIIGQPKTRTAERATRLLIDELKAGQGYRAIEALREMGKANNKRSLSKQIIQALEWIAKETDIYTGEKVVEALSEIAKTHREDAVSLRVIKTLGRIAIGFVESGNSEIGSGAMKALNEIAENHGTAFRIRGLAALVRSEILKVKQSGDEEWHTVIKQWHEEDEGDDSWYSDYGYEQLALGIEKRSRKRLETFINDLPDRDLR